MDNFLQLNSVSVGYNAEKSIVNDLSFTLREGELACLLGPSGCGKTTVLRAISGFQKISSGYISLDNTHLSDSATLVSPEQRNIGMVFQDHALFPHLSIAENVAFGLSNLAKREREERVLSLLKLVGLYDNSANYPHELSGGQSQRAALARALAPRPKLLLMDEPFSNLDADLRETLGYEVRALLKEFGMTAIMVTHDQHDAFALADKIGVISDGELIQWNSSYQLYHAPNSRFVANFVGDGVFVPGELVGDKTVLTNFGPICGGTVTMRGSSKEIDLLIRPDDVKINADSATRSKITRKAFKGAQTLYTMEMESGDTLISLVPSHENYEVDDLVGVLIDADHLVCFSREVN